MDTESIVVARCWDKGKWELFSGNRVSGKIFKIKEFWRRW
jgi:hypothetical protein